MILRNEEPLVYSAWPSEVLVESVVDFHHHREVPERMLVIKSGARGRRISCLRCLLWKDSGQKESNHPPRQDVPDRVRQGPQLWSLSWSIEAQRVAPWIGE